MRRLIPVELIGCAMLISGCATPTQVSRPAPQIEMPREASQACDLYLLPPSPSLADLEIGYVTRGAQIVACDAARELAVQTHAAEHALEDQVTTKGHRPGR
jgi:uncharacterized lipoprotein YajG